MTASDSETKFVDKAGLDHAIDELKKLIEDSQSGDIDLSDYVTQEQLQAALDSLDINIDLSGYATTAYVDNKVANIPSGGETDLSNYYTKAETYNKEEVNNLIPTVTNGTDGQDGFSPIATVSKSGNTATITITDKNGTTTASISDRKDGTGGGSSGGSGEIYSTEETAIGTWIDGRTVYRKVINFSDINSTNSNGFLFYTLTDDTLLINEVVDSKLILRNNTATYSSSQITSTLSSSNVSGVVSDINSKIVTRSMQHTIITAANKTIFQVFIGSVYNGTKKIYLILEYTKT